MVKFGVKVVEGRILCNKQFFPHIHFVPEAGLALPLRSLPSQCQDHSQLRTDLSTVPESPGLLFCVCEMGTLFPWPCQMRVLHRALGIVLESHELPQCLASRQLRWAGREVLILMRRYLLLTSVTEKLGIWCPGARAWKGSKRWTKLPKVRKEAANGVWA